MSDNAVLDAFVHDIVLVVTNDYDTYQRITAAVSEATRGQTSVYDFKSAAGEATSDAVYEIIDEESSGTANLLLRQLIGIGTHGWEQVAESFYETSDLPTEDEDEDD